MGHFKFNSRGGMSVDRDSLHASPEFKRQIEALSKLSGNPMTLPQNVADALGELEAAHDQRFAPWRNQWQTIRAHLMRQEAEIAEGDALRERLALILTRTANALKGDPGEFSLHSWHDLPECAQALQDRLAAADALLRDIKDWDVNAAQGACLMVPLRLRKRIQSHLQGAGDEA